LEYDYKGLFFKINGSQILGDYPNLEKTHDSLYFVTTGAQETSGTTITFKCVKIGQPLGGS
jgi:hypothetical protein